MIAVPKATVAGMKCTTRLFPRGAFFDLPTMTSFPRTSAVDAVSARVVRRDFLDTARSANSRTNHLPRAGHMIASDAAFSSLSARR